MGISYIGPDLATRPRHGAAGTAPGEAAVMILTEAINGTLVAKLKAFIDDDVESGVARMRWRAAADEGVGGFSRGERQLVLLAASLATEEVPVFATDVFHGLDHTTTTIVLGALAHSCGGWTLAELLQPDPDAIPPHLFD